MGERNWYSLSTLLKCKVDIDLKILQKAVDAVTDHHDMLRAVYSDKPYVRAPGSSVCTVKETKVRSRAAGLTFAERELRSFSLEEGKTLFITKIIYGTGSGRVDYLFIAVHQMVMSFYLWPVLLDDISLAYRSIAKGEVPEFPPKTTSYKEWLDLQNLELKYDEMKYWKEISSKINNVNQDKTFPFVIESGIYPTSISDALGDVSAREILLVAFMEAYGKLMGKDSLILRIKGHGDHLADLGRSIGWYTNLYPLELKITGDLRCDIEEVKSKLEAVPKDGVGYGVMYANDMKVHLPDITFCYSKEFDFENDLFTNLKRANRGHSLSDLSIGENMSLFISENKKGYMMRGFVNKELSALPQRFAERIKEIHEHVVAKN